MTKYLIKCNDPAQQRGFVCDPRFIKTGWTRNMCSARWFDSREAAQAECCDNEIVVDLIEALQS